MQFFYVIDIIFVKKNQLADCFILYFIQLQKYIKLSAAMHAKLPAFIEMPTRQ